MTITRTSTGFVISGKWDTVRVEFVTINGKRNAAIYEGRDAKYCPYPTLLEPFNPEDLGRIAYQCARKAAR